MDFVLSFCVAADEEYEALQAHEVMVEQIPSAAPVVETDSEALENWLDSKALVAC